MDILQRASWRDELEELDATVYVPPRTISVRCPTFALHGKAVLGTHGLVTLVDLPEETSVWQLKEKVDERLMLRPDQGMRLFSWGRELDDKQLLSDYRVADKATLEMQLCARFADPERDELQRVRVINSLIRTRQFAVDRATTVIELKRRIEADLVRGHHEWWTPDGQCVRCEGMTWVVACTLKADEKAGTSAIRQGEELISDLSVNAVDRKKGLLVLRRATSGRVATLHETSAVMLELPPDKQRLDYRGAAMAEDDATLWSLGVRHDDQIQLEFASPVMPDKLRIVRAPSPEKKPKGGKGKGKGDKGKAKKKK